MNFPGPHVFVPILDGFYEINVHGEVWRRGTNEVPRRKRKPVILRGYETMRLTNNSGIKNYSVHSLVAEAFLGPRPKGLCVNHIDANKRNNHPSNLEYCTAGENTNHARALGLIPSGNPKLTKEQVIEIRKRFSQGDRVMAISKDYPLVSCSSISHIITGRTWGKL